MSVRDSKMVSGSDSDGIEMFRAKNVGPVEAYMDSASSAEDYSIDGEGLIRWAKGRRSRNDEARLREVVGRKASSLGDADGPMMSTAGEGRRNRCCPRGAHAHKSHLGPSDACYSADLPY